MMSTHKTRHLVIFSATVLAIFGLGSKFGSSFADDERHGSIHVEGILRKQADEQASAGLMLDTGSFSFQLIKKNSGTTQSSWVQLLGKAVDVRGELEVRVDTAADGASQTLHFIHVNSISRKGDSGQERRTPLVKLIESCAPGTVNIYNVAVNPETRQPQPTAGSAFVIHPRGYAISNSHVVPHERLHSEAVMHNGQRFRYHLVGRGVDHDLALIKIDGNGPFPVLPLGRSHDVMLGESIVVIGNPFGLNHTVSRGIVSRLAERDRNGNPVTLQTDAAVNGGNSGGPMINMRGQVIGIMARKHKEAENINYAIAVDELRRSFGSLLAAELRRDFDLGSVVDTLGPLAKVTSVEDDSPSDTAGIKPGDVVIKINEKPIRDGIEFYMNLFDHKADDELSLVINRDDAEQELTVKLTSHPELPAVEEKNTEPGIRYSVFKGSWTQVPDFKTMKAAKNGIATTMKLPAELAGTDHFGVLFEGFVKIDKEGLYTFFTQSDDGSQLFVDDRQIVNNDGTHANWQRGGRVRLAEGLHKLVVTYFEAGGSEALDVLYRTAGGATESIPAKNLFHFAEPEAKQESLRAAPQPSP